MTSAFLSVIAMRTSRCTTPAPASEGRYLRPRCKSQQPPQRSGERRGMHELSIATSVVETCVAHAGGARILRVRLEVGQLAAVLPDSLRFCFEVCAHGTPAEGAELEILETPGR